VLEKWWVFLVAYPWALPRRSGERAPHTPEIAGANNMYSRPLAWWGSTWGYWEGEGEGEGEREREGEREGEAC